MCKGTIFSAWQVRCLKNLLALDNVKIVLLIIDANHDPSSSKLFAKIRRIRFRHILYQFFEKFILKPQIYRKTNLAEILSEIPSIRCEVIKKGRFSQYFNQADIEAIRRYELDFILRFGFNIIRGEILNVARYGIWSFHHDDEEKYRGAPPCFWEIYHGDDVTGAILQRLTDRLDGGVVLKKGFFKTIKNSYARNLNKVFFESTKWPAQVCIDLRNGCAEYLDNPPSQTKASIFYIPSNLQMLVFGIKELATSLCKLYNFLFRHEQWNIGVVYEPIKVFLKSGSKPKIHWLSAPKSDGFLADPFGLVKNGKLTVLCENFNYNFNKGIISAIEIGHNAKVISTRTALSLPTHTSYPYLFKYKEEIYCIPETADAQEISLYRAQESPHRWEKVVTLIKNIDALDPTIFQHENYLWLMCVRKKAQQELSIFYATHLLGPWKPHIANPAKIDIRSARPAGTLFAHNGYLYRPAQDCSKTYGGRIAINRIVHLTPTEFKEESVLFIEPDMHSSFSDGIHTISDVGNITLVDGKRLIFIPNIFIHRLTRIIAYVLKYPKNSRSATSRKGDILNAS
ncbi:MAG: hypothetical protein HQ593_04095 [Candidatus Omnitrophica bacterium]|nr:hypothetical protein [Candidatus Omnitrophota bacterium]